jgi:hypothetical protein
MPVFYARFYTRYRRPRTENSGRVGFGLVFLVLIGFGE